MKPTDKTWPWYMTVAALREFMRLAGYAGGPEDDNPYFDRAEAELGALCAGATHIPGHTTRSGAEIYRSAWSRIGPGVRVRVRLEFTVQHAPPGARADGEKPQLVRVRVKARRP